MVNWQDAIVTFVALGAAFVVARPLLPPRWVGRQATPGCSSCATGQACAVKLPASSATVVQVQRRRPPA
jgi:hypothetical protein